MECQKVKCKHMQAVPLAGSLFLASWEPTS